jgi:hypothetical protein
MTPNKNRRRRTNGCWCRSARALAPMQRELPISAIDRVMRAYASKYELNSSQAVFVRSELSKFIDELMVSSRRAPMMFPETIPGAAPRARQPMTAESAGNGIGNVRVVTRPD